MSQSERRIIHLESDNEKKVPLLNVLLAQSKVENLCDKMYS
jgi:hypothetical protein